MKYPFQAAAVAISSGVFAAAQAVNSEKGKDAATTTNVLTSGTPADNVYLDSKALLRNQTESSSTAIASNTLNLEQVKSELRSGRRLYIICSDCHTIDDCINTFGPDIFTQGRCVFGEKSGSTDPNFEYSPVMSKGEFVWTEEEVDSWLSNTHKFMAGTFMVFNGVEDPEERLQIIEWMKENCGDSLPPEFDRKWERSAVSKSSGTLMALSATALVTSLIMMGGNNK